MNAHDYVKETVELFCKNKAEENDPLAVIRNHIDRTASDELKQRCASEGKTPEGALAFLMAVQREYGKDYIPDSLGLAICMHYLDDVPADVLDEFEAALIKARKVREAAEAVKESYEAAVRHKLDYEDTPSENPSKTPQEASVEKTNDEPSDTQPTPQRPVHEQISMFDGLFT